VLVAWASHKRAALSIVSPFFILVSRFLDAKGIFDGRWRSRQPPARLANAAGARLRGLERRTFRMMLLFRSWRVGG
jgi:hypothetical protein